MILQVSINLFNDFGIMSSVGVEPEYGRPSSRFCTAHREFYPVLYGGVFYLSSAPDIAGFNGVFNQDIAGFIGHSYFAVTDAFEGFVV